MALGSRLAAAFVFARMLGASEVGVYFVAIAVAGIASVISRGGLDRLALSEAAHDPGASVAIYRDLGRWLLLTSAIALVIAPFLARLLFGSGISLETHVVAAASIPFINFTLLAASVLRGRGDVNVSMVVSEVSPPVLQLVIFLALPLDLTATRAVLAQLLAMVVASLLGLYLVRRTADTRAQHTLDLTWRQALPMLVVGLNGQFRQSFVSIASWFAGTPAQVGAMGAAFRTEQALMLPVNATRLATAPRLSSRERPLPQRVTTLAQHTARLAALLQIPLLAIGAVFASDLLSLLGDDFADGGPWLRILLIGSLINALTGTSHSVLLMSSERSTLAFTSTIASVVLATVGITVALGIGTAGVAVGLAASYVVMGLLEWAVIRRKLGARVDVFATSD
jgi:O-antigen/teichoic acid export membrane protein